jgi:uncharacterized damage-inducible protein DinB
MIKAIEINLHRGIKLLENISDEEYSNTSIAPYYSSIGSHMRHVLDVFDCIFEGIASKQINLIKRKRNNLAENSTSVGIDYFRNVLTQLNDLESNDFNEIVEVTDDLGLGVVTANYTLGGLLIQAHSHAIHHFASVGYVISQLGIQLPDNDFGFNPTTPKKETLN